MFENKKTLPLLTVALVFTLGSIHAQSQQAPGPQPLKPLHFPEFEQKTLENGLRVVVIEQHEQPAVSVRMLLRGGAVFDPSDKPGLAQFTATMLDQGTTSRSAQELAQAIDFVGGSLGASAGWDSAVVSSAVTSDQLELAMTLLSDIVLHPAFQQEEIDRQRTQAINGLQVQLQTPSYLANVAFGRVVFGDHPYGEPIGGTVESLRSITRDDLVRFHAERYSPVGAVLAVVGDVEPEAAIASVQKWFGQWKGAAAPTAPAPNFPQRDQVQVVLLDKPDAVQTEIRVGQIGIARNDPDYFVEQVYNGVMGTGSSSRLYEEIRGKRGLSYGAGSSFDERLEPGYFRVSTFTRSEKTVETLQVIRETLESVQRELVPAAELAARKAYITGAFPIQVETPDGIASQVLDALFHGYDRDYLEHYRERVDAVTAEQVQKFASERIHPDRMAIVLVGNATIFEEELGKLYQNVEKIPLTEVDLLSPDLRKKASPVAPLQVAPEDAAAATALLRQAVEAFGGRAYLDVKSQVSKGSGSLKPPGAPQEFPLQSVILSRVFPDLRRIELVLPFGSVVQVFDGEEGWVTAMGQQQDQTQQMKRAAKFGVELLRHLDEPGYSARPLDDAEVDGKPVRGVALADDEGNATSFYLDSETHRVVKVTYELDGQEVEEWFSDYRPVGGLTLPYKYNRSVNGDKSLELEFSEVLINPEVDPALFQKP